MQSQSCTTRTDCARDTVPTGANASERNDADHADHIAEEVVPFADDVCEFPFPQRPVSMKVLVLGGSGFIGQPAAQALSRAGHSVFVLTRSKEKAKKALEADERALRADTGTQAERSSHSRRGRSV
jgi:hypothetical protein